MHQRILLLTEASAGPQAFQACRSLGSQLAAALGEPVGVALLPKTRMQLVRTSLQAAGGDRYVEELSPQAQPASPMGSAPFLWREDGRPDWERMWTGFCELALFGGPPHRGEQDALTAPRAPAGEASGDGAIAEIMRGIRETTGLVAEPADPGWIAVRCASAKMAAWLCACIILENVAARCEEERLFLPGSQDFALKNEVKSVITVLAKTHHYWEAHLALRETRTASG